MAVLVIPATAAGAGAAADRGTAARPGGTLLASSAGGQVTDLRLSYGCQRPAGADPGTAAAAGAGSAGGTVGGIVTAGVEVAATFPATDVTGRPIQPTGVRVTVTLAHPVTASLLGSSAADVTAAARLTVGAAERGRSADRVWGARAATATPATGTLVLAATGSAPPVTPPIPSSPGTVTFTAGGLALALTATPGPAATASPAVTPGTPPSSPQRRSVALLDCAPAGVGRTTLARVQVTRGGAARSQHAHRAGRRRRSLCPPQPKGGVRLNKRFPLPHRPPGARLIHSPPNFGCAYVVGYSDVRKLRGAALIGPGISNLAIGRRILEKTTSPSYFEIDSAAQLDSRTCATCKVIHGFPPARATLLAFGFMPVTATMQLTEVGTIDIFSVGRGFALSSNTVWSVMRLRIYDVRVNGVPLDVGQHCQAASPILIKLVGTSHTRPPYSIDQGGPLNGTIRIPPFTGCGTTENLDPLFTASISGPGNQVRLTQGPVCFVSTGSVCPPRRPRPLH